VISNCVTVRQHHDLAFVADHAVAVHLCAQPGGTLIFVQRSLVLRSP
jgi:hypothetical protein